MGDILLDVFGGDNSTTNEEVENDVVVDEFATHPNTPLLQNEEEGSRNNPSEILLDNSRPRKRQRVQNNNASGRGGGGDSLFSADNNQNNRRHDRNYNLRHSSVNTYYGNDFPLPPDNSTSENHVPAPPVELPPLEDVQQLPSNQNPPNIRSFLNQCSSVNNHRNMTSGGNSGDNRMPDHPFSTIPPTWPIYKAYAFVVPAVYMKYGCSTWDDFNDEPNSIACKKTLFLINECINRITEGNCSETCLTQDPSTGQEISIPKVTYLRERIIAVNGTLKGWRYMLFTHWDQWDLGKQISIIMEENNKRMTNERNAQRTAKATRRSRMSPQMEIFGHVTTAENYAESIIYPYLTIFNRSTEKPSIQDIAHPVITLENQENPGNPLFIFNFETSFTNVAKLGGCATQCNFENYITTDGITQFPLKFETWRISVGKTDYNSFVHQPISTAATITGNERERSLGAEGNGLAEGETINELEPTGNLYFIENLNMVLVDQSALLKLRFAIMKEKTNMICKFGGDHSEEYKRELAKRKIGWIKNWWDKMQEKDKSILVPVQKAVWKIMETHPDHLWPEQNQWLENMSIYANFRCYDHRQYYKLFLLKSHGLGLYIRRLTISAKDCHRYGWDDRVNYLIDGSPGTSKSWGFKVLITLSLEGTVVQMTTFSPQAFNTNTPTGDAIMVIHEAPGWSIGVNSKGQKEQDIQGLSYLKDRLTSSMASTWTCVIKNGEKIRIETLTRAMMPLYMCTNIPIPDAEYPIIQRFLTEQSSNKMDGNHSLADLAVVTAEEVNSYPLMVYSNEKHIVHALLILVEKAIEASVIQDVNTNACPIHFRRIFHRLEEKYNVKTPNSRTLTALAKCCRSTAIESRLYEVYLVENSVWRYRMNKQGRFYKSQAPFDPLSILDVEAGLVVTEEHIADTLTLFQDIFMPTLLELVIQHFYPVFGVNPTTNIPNHPKSYSSTFSYETFKTEMDLNYVCVKMPSREKFAEVVSLISNQRVTRMNVENAVNKLLSDRVSGKDFNSPIYDVKAPRDKDGNYPIIGYKPLTRSIPSMVINTVPHKNEIYINMSLLRMAQRCPKDALKECIEYSFSYDKAKERTIITSLLCTVGKDSYPEILDVIRIKPDPTNLLSYTRYHNINALDEMTLFNRQDPTMNFEMLSESSTSHISFFQGSVDEINYEAQWNASAAKYYPDDIPKVELFRNDAPINPEEIKKSVWEYRKMPMLEHCFRKTVKTYPNDLFCIVDRMRENDNYLNGRSDNVERSLDNTEILNKGGSVIRPSTFTSTNEDRIQDPSALVPARTVLRDVPNVLRTIGRTENQNNSNNLDWVLFDSFGGIRNGNYRENRIVRDRCQEGTSSSTGIENITDHENQLLYNFWGT